MKNILFAGLFITMSACSFDNQEINSAEVATGLINGCGITSIKEDSSGFRFHCGLKGSDLNAIEDVSAITFKKNQLCQISYSENGQPKLIDCKEKPENLDSFIARGATLFGDWECKGLDGYGGYSRYSHEENISPLKLNENGEFELTILAKEGTDSIWYIKDSIITGKYVLDITNRIIFTPKTWSNVLIEKAGLTMTSAPNFMLVKPLELTVDNLTDENLEGESRWVSSKNEIVSSVSCITKSK
jgi:hypothetical protein